MSDNAFHPLGRLIRNVWLGEWPEPDGGWSRVPPWHDGLYGVVAFGGHDRVERAAWIRSKVTVFGLAGRGDVLVTIGDGVGCLPEVSVEPHLCTAPRVVAVGVARRPRPGASR